MGRVLVDLSGLRVAWLPALQVFPSTLASVGGWPAARLVLFGASDELRNRMQELRISEAVPLVPDEGAARTRLCARPSRIVRYHNLRSELLAQRRSRRFVQAACTDDIAIKQRKLLVKHLTEAGIAPDSARTSTRRVPTPN